MYTYVQMRGDDVKSEQASKLRQRKHALAQRFQIPRDLLPGSLSESHYRCGKPSCHCANDEGHSGWALTFTVDGEKRVERVPKDWVEEVRRRVEAGREFQEAVKEVLAANAQLLALERRQLRGRQKRKKAKTK
jgi:hypothetical protein